MALKQPISFIDIETTGLDKTINSILEISIITLTDLNSPVEDMPSLDILFTYNYTGRLQWHREAHDLHKKSGLVDLLSKDKKQLTEHEDCDIRRRSSYYDYIFESVDSRRHLVETIVENHILYVQKIGNIKDASIGGVNFGQFDFPFLTHYGLLSPDIHRFVEVGNLAAVYMYSNGIIDEFYIPGSKEFYRVLVPNYNDANRHIARYDNLAAVKSVQTCLKGGACER